MMDWLIKDFEIDYLRSHKKNTKMKFHSYADSIFIISTLERVQLRIMIIWLVCWYCNVFLSLEMNLFGDFITKFGCLTPSMHSNSDYP